MQAEWRETTVGEHGEVVVEGLPFDPGQTVEVLVISKSPLPIKGADRTLHNSVLEYRDPLEPIADEDWDALR